MEQAILNVRFVPHMGDGTVEPSCPQYGGVQGDRNATRLGFLVPAALRGSQFRYRIEGEDGAGGFISTELLAIDDEGYVETLLDERFTAAGGQILVRLVVSEMVNDNEVTTVRSFDGRLFFADAPAENVSSAFRDTLSAMVARTEDKLKIMTALADDVTTRTATMENTLGNFGERLTTAENTVDAVEDRVDAHDTRFTTDEQTADDLDFWVERLSDKIDNVTGMAEMKEDEPTPWKFIQKIVRAGLARQLFSIGDRFVSSHRDYGNIVWEIVDFDHDTPIDDRFTHSITLQTVDCLHDPNGQYDLKEFDAPSESDPKGISDWAGSDLRAWLNSKNEAGHWFAADEGQTPPDYAAQAGFMNGMSSSFLSVIGTVITPVALNSSHTTIHSDTSFDKIFLPSRVEIYAGEAPGTIIPEQGTARTLYSEGHSTLSVPGVGSDSNRVKLLNGTATAWWTRSANILYTYNVMRVSTSGGVSTISAKEKLAVAPMCCIY